MAEGFEDVMKALAAEYRDKLPARLAEMERLWGASESDAAALVTLRRELHTLAGSATTFGLPALTAAARAVEHRLDPVVDQGAALDRTALRALLDGVRASIGAADQPAKP